LSFERQAPNPQQLTAAGIKVSDVARPVPIANVVPFQDIGELGHERTVATGMGEKDFSCISVREWHVRFHLPNKKL
jgi:hypothetical protein